MGATQKLLRFGVFEINLDTVELRKSGVVVRLPPQPFKLLVLLASHAGQLVTREEIETQLWGDETHVDFEHGVNKCVKQIRTVLGDDADQPLYIETLPRQGYRFLAPVVSKTIAAPGPRVVESQSGERGRTPALSGAGPVPLPVAGATAPAFAQPQALTAASPETEPIRRPAATDSGAPSRQWGRNIAWFALAVLVPAAAVVAALLYWRAHSRPVLTEKDTIVIADFDNKTGDPVFDGTLRQGLLVDLDQSPFLNILPEKRISQTMSLMAQPKGAAVTSTLAREVCIRTGSAATLEGAIAALGSDYVVGLKAINCRTSEELAAEQFTVDSKDKVLPALGEAASRIRSKLGESLASVRKYGTPLPEATTSSLEALKALSLGYATQSAKGDSAALPFFQRAIELDPDFAKGYVAISGIYANFNELGLASQNARKAYALRAKVSERERFSIDADYYLNVTGEMEKAAQTYEIWHQVYPRDQSPPINLAFIYSTLGNLEGSLPKAEETMRLEPGNEVSYVNLAAQYTYFNRLDEAEAVLKQAEERKLDSEAMLLNRYELAFLKGDATQMAQLASAAVGKPGAESSMLASQADTEGWYGRFKSARELTLRAMQSAQRSDAREAAAAYQAAAALRDSVADNRKEAIAEAHAALKLAENRDVKAMAALALAQAGDTKGAEKLAAELAQTFPLDTLVQKYWLPTIRAAVALERKDPAQAVSLLNMGSTLELSQPVIVTLSLCPVYVRGQAYLGLHNGKAAAAEFEKFIDHYGLVLNFPWGAAARLGLARAYAMQAETDAAARDKARTAYQNFFTLWKGADSELPIYQQAKAEYAKLQ